MKRFIIVTIVLVLLFLFFTKRYTTYQDISNPATWKPEKCIGVSIKNPFSQSLPDGPDRLCFGVVT